MIRWKIASFGAALWLAATVLGTPLAARADDVAEAGALFTSGNGHFERAQHLRGARRAHELEAALADYFQSLRILRSRNVLYNTAIVLEQLGRWDESFNYWSEYLAVTGLSDAERADGTTHRDAALPHVAAVHVSGEPAGAAVWIDRRDLATRGHTPFDIALAPGEHHFYVEAEGYLPFETTATAVLGETHAVAVTLTPAPVSLQVFAPDEGMLTLDGAELRPGASTSVVPGTHELRLEIVGAEPVVRHFEVVPGSVPMVIDLTSSVHRVAAASVPLGVHADADAHVVVDGADLSHGTDVVVGVAPGPHEVRIEASGRAPAVVRGTFSLGSPMRLDAHLAPTADSGLLAARGIFGAAAIVGIGVSLGFLIDAQSKWDHYQNNEIPGEVSQDAQIANDVSWSITGAIGLTALVLCFLDAGGGESSARFVLAPTSGGAVLAASGRFGGL